MMIDRRGRGIGNAIQTSMDHVIHICASRVMREIISGVEGVVLKVVNACKLLNRFKRFALFVLI